MADDVPDFITQVRNPNETDNHPVAEPTASPQQPQKPPPKKSCFFFCCGGGPELDDYEQQSKKPPPKLSISSGTSGGGASGGPSSGGGTGSGAEGQFFNSPRISGKYQTQGQATYTDDHLLPPPNDVKKGKKCLVLDLDETLVHSSFKQVPCDFVVPVTIEDKTYKVYVAKRPHVDTFLQRCGELYEVVVFTASLAQYADPVIDLLDPNKWVDWRLFRESCTPFKGAYVKDMGRMGRDINTIMILDNSPHSYLFNRENAIPCKTWYNDHTDRELLELIPALEQLAQESVQDVRDKLREMGISPGELEDGLEDSTGTDEGSDYTGTEPSQTEGSMEDSDFTGEDVEGSSEYTATESQKGEDPN